MRVFITGATGFVGLAVTKELVGAGHQVLGLARSDEGAKSLTALGAQPHRGTIQDLEILRTGVKSSDAVIHLAFNHDFSKFAANCEDDRVAIDTLGEALAGSDRPFLVTSGIPQPPPGRLATENDPAVPASPAYPRVSEKTALDQVARGVRASVVRLPQVHDPVKQGLITFFVDIARQKGVSAYVGEGSNRFAAVHVLDAARLYRLALEKGATGAKYHAVAEEGIPLREIAEVIGHGLKVPVVSKSPEEAAAHFGWLAMFVNFQLPASSAITQQLLNWHPTGPTLISDLQQMNYNAPAAPVSQSHSAS